MQVDHGEPNLARDGSWTTYDAQLNCETTGIGRGAHWDGAAVVIHARGRPGQPEFEEDQQRP